MIVLEGAAWQTEQATRAATATAWFTAALQRGKKLPALNRFLGKEKTAKGPQSIEEQAAIIRTLHARLGGTLTGTMVEKRNG